MLMARLSVGRVAIFEKFTPEQVFFLVIPFRHGLPFSLFLIYSELVLHYLGLIFRYQYFQRCERYLR